MKLTRTEVKGYRSFVDLTTFDFGDGMNALVGRNNCGKSNLLSAITLAMDPESEFDKTRDTPAQMSRLVPRVALDFHVHGRISPERTLLRYAQEYEEAVGSPSDHTFASQGKVRLVVEYQAGQRQEYFQAARMGGRKLSADDDRLRRLCTQFRSATRYVLVRSGESLESLLNGRFRDILALVLKEQLSPKVAAAEKVRSRYVEGLQDDLLLALRERVGDLMSEVFPEITGVSLVPNVPDLDHTLGDMRIELQDAARTDLLLKGTGVRGGVLLALLRYLADQTRRSIVFAVEEPEAFLHPGAQEELREELEALAERDDVTLLVTTHSPFIVSREPAAQVIALRKDLDGRTCVKISADGTSTEAAATSDLFRDPGLADVLREAIEVPLEGCGAVLVVEGDTDEQYLRVAAERSDRMHVLKDVRVVAAGGAQKAVVQAILLSHRSTLPVFVLLDHDEMGRVSADRLRQLAGFTPKKEILTLSGRAWVPQLNDEVEAEDLWPERLLVRFVAEQGQAVLAEKIRIGRTDHFRYGFTAAGKELVGEWLARYAKPADCARWADLLDALDARIAAAPAHTEGEEHAHKG